MSIKIGRSGVVLQMRCVDPVAELGTNSPGPNELKLNPLSAYKMSSQVMVQILRALMN
jgi:hypothetical protein